jgi:PilZ domain-containing protein
VSERRVHLRVKGPFEGYWDGSGTQAGRIVDLSVGGCFVESVSPPDPSRQRATVTIMTSLGRLDVVGEVIYVEAGLGFAVRFLDPPANVVEIIEKEVASRANA